MELLQKDCYWRRDSGGVRFPEESAIPLEIDVRRGVLTAM